MRLLFALFATALGLSAVLAWQLHASMADLDNPVPVRTGVPAPAAMVVPGWDPAALSEIADTILMRPLFSPTRRLTSLARPKQAATPVQQDAAMRLTGIIVGPENRLAIFADPSGKSRSAAIGESVGNLTVELINPGKVTVTGPAGKQVLHPSYQKPTGVSDEPGIRK